MNLEAEAGAPMIKGFTGLSDICLLLELSRLLLFPGFAAIGGLV